MEFLVLLTEPGTLQVGGVCGGAGVEEATVGDGRGGSDC